MITLEQFHQNIWKFIESKKTLEEALEAYENMSITSKRMLALFAFKLGEAEIIKDKNGECLKLVLTPEEIEHFTLSCMLKEKEGWFDDFNMEGAFNNSLGTDEE